MRSVSRKCQLRLLWPEGRAGGRGVPYLLTWRDRDMSEAPGQLQISVLWNLRSDMLAGRDISGRTEPRTKTTRPWPKWPGPL